MRAHSALRVFVGSSSSPLWRCGGILAALCLVGAFPLGAAGPADFQLLRSQWRAEQTGETLTPAELADPLIAAAIAKTEKNARAYVATLDTSASRTALWHEDGFEQTSSNKAGPIAASYGRVATMAQAYAMSGTTYTAAEKTALLATIGDCMTWLHANWYNPTTVPNPPTFANPHKWPEGYDWAYMQMFVPNSINSILVLARAGFTGAQIDTYTGTIMAYNSDLEYGGSQGNTLMLGANLSLKCLVFALAGANAENAAYLDTMQAKWGPLFAYAIQYPDPANRSGGDGGFYSDGSYLQHYNYSYIGQYGMAALESIGDLSVLLRGSAVWPIDSPATNPNFSNVFKWIRASVQPFVYRGAMLDMTRGRFIQGSPSTRDHNAGGKMMRALAALVDVAPATDADFIRGYLKHWEQAATEPPYNYTVYSGATIADLKRLDTVFASATPAAAEPQLSRVYPVMDQAVHLRPGFGFALSMYSDHMKSYETLNGQNLRGWYLNDGQTYLYNCDLMHYSDSYWATVDKYRLPGTTVDTRALTDKQFAGVNNPNNEVGGVSLLDQFSVAGMRVKSQVSTLGAKKAWFMFDNEVVALGADVTSTDSAGVATTIDNRRIKDDASNVITANGAALSLTLGSTATVAGASWLHLGSNLAGNPNYAPGEGDLGYYFPTPATVKVLKQQRSAAWSDITDNYEVVSSLLPVVDTYAQDGSNAGTSFASSASLDVKTANAGYNRQAFLKFDLTGLRDIEFAKLYLTGQSMVAGASVTLNVSGLTDDSWTSALTWNTRPTDAGTGLGSFTASDTVGTNSIDVTTFTKAQGTQSGGNDLVSFRLDAGSYNMLYSASSADSGLNVPQLSMVRNPVHTDAFATFWLDHGANPTAQAYAYVILPDRTIGDVQAYATNPDIAIIRNDATAQGVKEKTQNVTGAIFWTDAIAGAGLVTANRKAAVMVRETGGVTPTLDVSTADLTEANTSTIEVTLARSATGYTLGAGVNPASVTIQQLSPWIKFSVSVNNSIGAGFPLQFQGAGPATLEPIIDAYVRDGTYANDNFGGSSNLFSTTASINYSKRTYLQFDVSAFRDIERATLRLYGSNSQDLAALQVKAFGAVSNAWTESGITWNNAPATTPATPLATTTVTNAAGYYEWDVTAFVRPQINTGAGVVTLVLVGDARNFLANSREASANRPQLVLQ